MKPRHRKEGDKNMGKEASPDFKNKVTLRINDISIGLNEFADDIVRQTILGMLKALNTEDIEEFKNVKIVIDNQ
ncbi:MAG: hypothetical protein ACSW71_02110 [Methanobrevibacter sp.]